MIRIRISWFIIGALCASIAALYLLPLEEKKPIPESQAADAVARAAARSSIKLCQDRGWYDRCVANGDALCVKVETNLPDCPALKGGKQ